MARKHAEIPDWLHSELLNWGRWCWRGAWPHPLPQQQCASLEGNYSRFGEHTDEEAIDRKPIPVNETNAKIVQGVYEALPWLQAQVLRAEYPQRHSSAQQRLRAQVGRDGYDAALNVALFHVMATLDGRG